MSTTRTYVIRTALFMGVFAAVFLYALYTVGNDISPVTGKFTGQLQFSVGDEVNTTNSSEGETSGSNVGSGGSGTNTIVEIITSTDVIQVSLLPGESKKETFTLTNKGAKQIILDLNLQNASYFVDLETTHLTLQPGESKNISLTFFANESEAPALHIGSLQISGSGVDEIIILALEIQSANALLDVGLEIPSRFLEISYGQDAVALVHLYNLGETGKVDVELEYIIKNIEDAVVLTQQEVVAVETQTSFVKNFVLPSGLPTGKYVIYVRATYSGKVASASSWFKLVSLKEKSSLPLVIVTVSLAAALAIIFFLYKINTNHLRYERKFKYGARVA